MDVNIKFSIYISNGDDTILQYLQGKRGIEKPPFDLPDFIKKTGIMEMRASLQEKEDQRTLKAKMRERARPKLGKIDIDYQKLHDAFFKLVIKCLLILRSTWVAGIKKMSLPQPGRYILFQVTKAVKSLN